MPNSGWHRLDIVALLPDLFWADIVPPTSVEFPAGWSYLPQRFWIALPAFFIMSASLCAGRLALRGLDLFDKTEILTSLALASSLGLSICSVTTLILGLIGLLDQVLFCAMLCIVLVIEGTLIWRTRTAFYKVSSSSRKKERDKTKFSNRLLSVVCLAGCGMFLGVMLLGAMLPSTDFDVKEYHLQGPKEFFLAGQILFLPHNVYTSFPFLTEMLSLCGMVVVNDWQLGALVGKCVLMCFAPITALGIFAITIRIADKPAAWLAALFYLSTPWVTRISIIAYTEGALCCYAIITLLAIFVMKAQSRSQTNNWSLVVGLLAGSSVATKYPGLLLVAMPAGIVVLHHVLTEQDRKWSRVWKVVGLFSLGVLLTFGPWMAKNLEETGNPVYPLLYSVFGGTDWNAELQQKWKDGHPPLGIKNGFRKLFTDIPANLLDVSVKSDWQSPLLFAFAPLAFFVIKNRNLILWAAGHVLWMGIVWYIFTHRIDRFWLPLLPGVSVLAAIGYRHLWNMTFEDPQGSPLLRLNGIVLPISVLGAILFNFGFVTSPLVGNNSFLLDLNKAREVATTPSIALIESLKLERARVLFVGEAQVFDAHFDHLYNTVFDVSLFEQLCAQKTGQDEWELLPEEEILQNFNLAGITHVFVNWNEIVRYRTTYRYTNFVTPERLQQSVALGILKPMSLDPRLIYRAWNTNEGGGGVDESWKLEIDRWGPSLKKNFAGTDVMIQYEMFEVPLKKL